MRAVHRHLALILAMALMGCRQGLLTGPVEPPGYVRAMLGQWNYAATFTFERAHAAGATLDCTITGMVLHVTEPIGHDDGFLSSGFWPDASAAGGTLSCAGAATFSVSIDEAIREASALSTALNLDFRVKVLTPVGLITVWNTAWRNDQVAGDLVTSTAWAGRVWASDDATLGGPPSPPDGSFTANKR